MRPRIGTLGACGTPAQSLSYDYAAGVAAVVAVPTGAYLLSVTAFSAAAGATLQIGAGDVIPMPDSGAVQLTPDGGVMGPVNVSCVGTSGYIVEWLL